MGWEIFKLTKKKKLAGYAMLGIFVLALSIIGVTFAYFQATASSNDGTLTGNMATVKLDLDLTKVTEFDDEVGLVPLSNNMIHQALTSNKGVCIDDNGNVVCQVYKITIRNEGTINTFVDGFVSLIGGSGEPADYTEYNNEEAKTSMRWVQAFCSTEVDGIVTSCTTAGTSTTRTDTSVAIASIGGADVKDDPLNLTQIKTTKDSVITTSMINNNPYGIINQNYIRVSDHQLNSNIYTQDADVTSALVYNQYLLADDNNSGNNTGTSSSTYKDSQVYYIAVWLSENGHNQTTGATGASPIKEDFFGGKVTFVSSMGSNSAVFGNYHQVAMMSDDSGNSGDSEVLTLNAYARDIMAPHADTDEDIDFWYSADYYDTNGIYVRSGTENNDFPIYYYRGEVNNNLFFGGVCWKVVRTTDTGGLKIIYNGFADANNRCNNSGVNTIVDATAFNENKNSLAYAGYMYGTPYTAGYKELSYSEGLVTKYVHGNGVTYSNGKYTLTNTISDQTWESLNRSGFNNYHYTCFSTESTCEEVYYIYNTHELDDYTLYPDGKFPKYAYYLTLTGGDTIYTAIDEMKYTNTNSSTIKTSIDEISAVLIDQLGFGSYFEDTVWCYDRDNIFVDFDSPFNPNGGPTHTLFSYLYNSFRVVLGVSENQSEALVPNLSWCRKEDRFTVSPSKGNGALNYPVGLLTADEALLAGIGIKDEGTDGANSSVYLNNNFGFWLGTPVAFAPDEALVSGISNTGSFGGGSPDIVNGVRPVVSLKSGFTLTGNGDGSANNPYVVDSNIDVRPFFVG